MIKVDNTRASLELNGFARISEIFSQRDLEKIKNRTASLIQDWYDGNLNSPDFWNGKDNKGNKILYRIHNFEKHYPPIKQLIEKPKFRALVEQVLGINAVPTVFALIIKMPNNGAAVPWHRDIDKISPNEVYNFSIYLDDSCVENGCLAIVPGTHKDTNDYSKILEPPIERINVSALETEVIIHDVRVLHGSGSSRSSSIRRSVVIEYKLKS